MLPKDVVKPNLGFKTYIAYGLKEALGKGDSVTKLHCVMFDVVKMLVVKAYKSAKVFLARKHRAF
jgi:lysine-specific demethylase 3